MRISRRRCAICITRRAARTPSWSRRLFACRPRLRTNWASRPQDVPRCPRTSPGLMTRIARKRGDFGEQVVCTGSALAAERDVSGDVLSTFSAYSVNLLRGTSWRTCREAFEGLLAMALRAPGNGLGRAIGRWVGWGRAGELGLRAGSAGPGRCRAAQAGRRWLAVSRARNMHRARTRDRRDVVRARLAWSFSRAPEGLSRATILAAHGCAAWSSRVRVPVAVRQPGAASGRQCSQAAARTPRVTTGESGG